jgi:DNA (cytosine-5)-methyltransferase 1
MPKATEYRGAGRVADMQRDGLEGLAGDGHNGNQPGRIGADATGSTAAGGESLRVADSTGGQREQCLRPQRDELQRFADNGTVRGLANATSGARAQHVGEPGDGSRREAGPHNGAERGRDNGGMDNPNGARRDGSERNPEGNPREETRLCVSGAGCENMRMGDPTSGGCGVMRDASQPGSCGHAISPGWSRFEIVHCRDGKARRFEPGSFPLAHGLPGRVGLLRGYGNAIVPQVAAEFIQAFREAIADLRRAAPQTPIAAE